MKKLFAVLVVIFTISVLITSQTSIALAAPQDVAPGRDKGTKNATGCDKGTAKNNPNCDSDEDGVPDAVDQCPDTPLGVEVGPDGCPLIADRDGDGIADEVDTCPDQAPIDPDAPDDHDGDNVTDSNDAIPCTPQPGIDSDGDGIPDEEDNCPSIPDVTNTCTG